MGFRVYLWKQPFLIILLFLKNFKKAVRACQVTSVVSNSLRPFGLQPPRLLSSRESPGKKNGVGCHSLLQGIFPTQGSNLCLIYPALAGRLFTTRLTWEVLESHSHIQSQCQNIKKQQSSMRATNDSTFSDYTIYLNFKRMGELYEKRNQTVKIHSATK